MKSFRIRHCAGHMKAWCMETLGSDGVALNVTGSYVTALTLDVLWDRAVAELGVKPGDRVEMVL